MKIRLIKPYLYHAAGDVIETFDDSVCRLLIERGLATRVRARSTDAPPRDKAVKRSKTRRKSRRRAKKTRA